MTPPRRQDARSSPHSAASPPTKDREKQAEKRTRRGQRPNRPTECAYCGGPLPPPAVTGRPRTFCSAQCRRANEWGVDNRRREERERREREQQQAEAEARYRAREEEAARREEREYRRAIEAGGNVAATARWWRLYDETLDATGSRWGLCQWALDNDEPGACTRRTADVYCWRHNRQLERESAKRRREREAASRAASWGRPRSPGPRRSLENRSTHTSPHPRTKRTSRTARRQTRRTRTRACGLHVSGSWPRLSTGSMSRAEPRSGG
jgi:hypothetical protein